MPPNKGRKLPPELLTADDVRALLAACSATAPTGLRNRALVVALYRAGLRLEEALALAPADADLATGVIRVHQPDAGRSRVAGIDPGGSAVIEAWVTARAGLRLSAAAPLFCTLAGGRLQPAYVRQLLPRLAEKAGVAKRVHAQGLRYSHAVELAAEGLPAEAIQAQLGHGSLASTGRYLRRLPAPDSVGLLRRRRFSP